MIPIPASYNLGRLATLLESLNVHLKHADFQLLYDIIILFIWNNDSQNNKIKYYKRSISLFKSPKNESLCFYCILYLSNFAINLYTICLDLQINVLLIKFWHSPKIIVCLSFHLILKVNFLWMLPSFFFFY